jgi:hypothetical protein
MAKQKSELADPIQIGAGRLSFPSLFEPKLNDDGNSRYEATLLMPPGFDTKPLLEALEKVAVEQFGKRELWPDKMRKPEDVVATLTKRKRTMSGKELVGYEPGWTPIAAADPKRQPKVVDRDNKIVTDPKQVYGGRWARLLIRPYAYANKSAGVTFALLGVRLLKDDEPFGGGVDVQAAFAGIDDSEDDNDDAI